MCSDGLTKELSDAQIVEIIGDSPDPFASDSLAGRLVDAAVTAGGRDNVTVVAVGAVWTDAGSGGSTPMPAFLEETAPRK
jgi:protein phosphatase